MKKILFILINITWCLPQNLIGAILYLFNLNKPHTLFNQSIVTKWYFGGSVSLGAFIFVSSNNKQLIKHEYGHTIQSLILGFFYLLIIGLPSIIWCSFFKNYRTKHKVSYDDFYTEKWANYLGKVN